MRVKPMVPQRLVRFDCRGNRCAGRGFSLLEVIVAMTLATVLLGAVWTLFQILTKRQAIEIRQAETNQMRRSLHQRLTRDLNNLPAIDRRAAMSLPPVFDPESMPGGRLPWPYNVLETAPHNSTSMTVLRGSQSSLTLSQFLEPGEWSTLNDQDDDTELGHQPTENPPLIKQVIYQLPTWPQTSDGPTSANVESNSEDVNDIEGDVAQQTTTLVREEILAASSNDHNSIAEWSDARKDDYFSDNENVQNVNIIAARDGGPLNGEENASKLNSRRETLDDISVASFAYFDGRRWRSEWDSDLEKRLPVAIRFRWRQTAVPLASTSESSSQYSDSAPPDEFSEFGEGVDTEFAGDDELSRELDTEVESIETRWYEGEWIFLIQPGTNPAAAMFIEKVGIDLRHPRLILLSGKNYPRATGGFSRA